MSTGTTRKAFAGKPVDIGAQVFNDVVMPIVREASTKMDARSLAGLYAGFLCAAYGSMQADFGKERADTLFDAIQAAVTDMEPLQTARTH